MKPPNRLSELRAKRDLTQAEVATLLGVDIATVSRHETGSRTMSPEIVKLYAKLYRVQSYELFVVPMEEAS
jgi:transcriptional regulator with XRE-family HTH domain